MVEEGHIDRAGRPGPTVRALSFVSTTRLGRWIARQVGWRLDPVLLRLTGGRFSSTLVIPSGVLETTGARTGTRRRNAVIHFPDEDAVVIAASHAGAPRHPAWFHNLIAHPDVFFGGVPMRAEVVPDADRDRLWRVGDQVFPGYVTYRREAALAGRTIPLVKLRRR